MEDNIIIDIVPDEICPGDFLIEQISNTPEIGCGMIIFSQKCHDWFFEKSDRKEQKIDGKHFEWDEFFDDYQVYFEPLDIELYNGNQMYLLKTLSEGKDIKYELNNETNTECVYILSRSMEKFETIKNKSNNIGGK